nr:ribonuclease H-like domain-containing protein [Tanacetum cinerariifolium]
MPTKIELTLEQSQQGVSNDVLVVVGYRCALCRGYLVQLLSSFEIICGIGRTCMWIICGIMRSNLLARDPLPDVNDAFAIVSREQSDKGPAPGKHAVKVCNHYGLIGHTIKRCYEYNGYSDGFKRNPNLSKQSSVVRKFNGNASVSQSASTSSLHHMTISIKNMFNVVDISSLMFTMGHPNGTWAKNTTIGSLRLGHLANQVLFVLGDKIKFKTSDHVPTCDICHKAKLTREPFPQSDQKSIGLDDLIHLNVWGPYKVISMDGIQSLIDEERDPSNVKGNGCAASDDYVEIVDDELVAIATQIDDSITFEGNNQSIFNGDGSNNFRNEP